MKVMRLVIVVMVAFVTTGAGDCNPPSRPPGVARSEGVRLLRAPVICEGNSNDGYICVDNKGGMVTCPSLLGEPCKVVAGKPEAPAP